MALTLIEQLKVLAGDPSPNEVKLLALVQQASYKFAKQFSDDLKNVTGVELAENYANKMLAVSRRVLRNDDKVNAVLTRMMVTLIGESSATFAQVTSATDEQWETFVTSNIDETFEYIADVRLTERAAYSALPSV